MTIERAAKWTISKLVAFEARVRDAFERGEVRGPLHLSGGNEAQLIDIFRDVREGDYVFSTWRNHYHALLHGIPEDWVYEEILAGRSLSLNSSEHRFYTSAIVGGCLPIATGVAAAIKRRGGDELVWCFVGDMAASIGVFRDAVKYASCNSLPIMFVVEDNGLSTETPTPEAWGITTESTKPPIMEYLYERTMPHYGSGAGRTM